MASLAWLRTCIRCGWIGLASAACSFDSSGGSGGSDGSSGSESSAGATLTTTTNTATTAGTTASDSSGSGDGPTSGATTTTDPSGSSSSDGADGSSSTGVPIGDFGEPIAVDVLNSESDDDDATLSSDMLEIYFASTRLGNEDIFVAHRGSVTEDFDEPVRVDELSSSYTDSTPELSFDGLTMTVTSDRPGTFGGLDVWVSTRDNRTDAWSDPTHIGELSTISNEGSVVLTADLLTVYLCESGGPPDYDQIVFATREHTGDAFGVPAVFADLNADGRDCTPFVVADNTELWWASTRAGGEGAEDIWRIDLVDGLPSGTAEVIDEVNDDSRDEDPWVSPDGATMFFSSARAGMGGQDIYMAMRQ